MDTPPTFPHDAGAPARLSMEGGRVPLELAPFFHAMPLPCMLLTPQLAIFAANDAYMRLSGRQRKDVVGRHIFDAFPDNPHDPLSDGAANMLASLQRVCASGQAEQLGIQRYDVATEADGNVFETRYWKPQNIPVQGADGSLRYIMQMVEEVSDFYLPGQNTLRDVLANLSESLRDLRAASEIGHAAAAILGVALQASRVGYGTIDLAAETLEVARDWCAPGVETLAGVTALRDYGSFIDDLKQDQFIAIVNVDNDPRTAGAAAALRARSAAAFVNVPVLEDGVLVAVLFVNDAQVRHWTGEEMVLIKEVAARIRAATERERSASALSRSEAKFRTITDAMPQMVWSTLPDGYHDYYNEQWYGYTGVPRGSTHGDGWNDIFHPDDRERAWAAWHASLASGDTYEIQYRLRHHSGSYRWVLGRALPVHADDGSIVRWMGTCTDIDDQKHAEDELRRLGVRKDEFLAMLAHELRNPLAPISSAAQLLLLGGNDPQRVQKSAGVIQRQVRHLTNLVDDLLDVSRVTRGLVRLDRRVLDLRDVLHGAVEQVRPAIDARRHQLAVTLPPAPVLVSGDRTRLVQVVVNLLSNAAKYTLPGGHLALSVQVADGQARITVGDNGIGMAPELLPHVFELFVQAERTQDRAQGGLGLGLALVQRIAELHGGSVQAHSAGLGQGSTVTVQLPLAEGESSLAFDAEPMPPATPGAVRIAEAQLPRLLLLDDHIDGVQMFAALLRARGYPVTIAQDGASMLQMAAQQHVDTFILDIGLPEMDGYELARRLRASPATARAQLIALTGYGKEEDRQQALLAGFDQHLVKPVDIAELIKLLDGRRTA
ncbi:ATP-binding protein [Janthinobacterium sp.]|uniref:ATP-binding protein n=1 Tax=Janthinobacterium sp. TaxID=1871054 RepID=UPI00289E9AC9|nr:ATP-binding protein [Janthinobacterium sp.]